MPACPAPKVLDEVTRRCVYLEDCEWPGFLTPPLDFLKIPGVSLTSHAQSPRSLEMQGQHSALWEDPVEQAETSSCPFSLFHGKNEAQGGQGTGLGVTW